MTDRIDWYDRRSELRVGDVFTMYDGDLVRLYGRVEGDGTQWHVEDWSHGSWGYWESIIEPGDLVDRVPDPQPIRKA